MAEIALVFDSAPSSKYNRGYTSKLLEAFDLERAKT
jgi:hypothetical protein